MISVAHSAWRSRASRMSWASCPGDVRAIATKSRRASIGCSSDLLYGTPCARRQPGPRQKTVVAFTNAYQCPSLRCGGPCLHCVGRPFRPHHPCRRLCFARPHCGSYSLQRAPVGRSQSVGFAAHCHTRRSCSQCFIQWPAMERRACRTCARVWPFSRQALSITCCASTMICWFRSEPVMRLV